MPRAVAFAALIALTLLWAIGPAGAEESDAGAPTRRRDPANELIERLRLQPMTDDPGRTASDGKPTLLMLWRADCAPCVIELKNIAGLEAAAGDARLIVVALDSPDVAKATLQRLGVQPRAAWRSLEAPETVLVALNGLPPRLPLAVALDGDGSICGRHVGLLGTELVAEWIRQCSK